MDNFSIYIMLATVSEDTVTCPWEWHGVSVHTTAAKRAIIWQKQAVPLNRPIMRQNEAYRAIFCT